MIKPVLALCICHPDYRTIGALMNVIRTNYFVGCSLSTMSLLPYVRNSVIRQLLTQNPEFTHLILIDDDMADFEIEHIKALIDADEPIISALLCMRRPPYTLVGLPLDIKQDDVLKYMKEQSIVEVDHTGMAFTCIKREVIDALREETPNGPIWFNMDREERDSFHVEYYDRLIEWRKRILAEESLHEIFIDAVTFGQTSHLTANLLGEDVSFCRKAAKFGYKSYVHCGIVVGHVGTQPYTVRDTLKLRIEESCIIERETNDEKNIVPSI